MVNIPQISPIRFYEQNGTNIENNSFFERSNGVVFQQQFKQLAKTVVYSNDFDFDVLVSVLCNKTLNSSINIGTYSLAGGDILYFYLKGQGRLVINNFLTGAVNFDVDSEDYILFEYVIPNNGNYSVELTTFDVETCVKDLLHIRESLIYSICGEEYQAKFLEPTPYLDNAGVQLYAFELSTADHSTDEGMYIIEVGVYISEPIYINNDTEWLKVAYKEPSYRYCALRNYTYVSYIPSDLSYLPKSEISVLEGQNRNKALKGLKEFYRKFANTQLVPDYFGELVEQIFIFSEVKINDIEYTIGEDVVEIEQVSRIDKMVNFSVNVRKESECADFGLKELKCIDGIAIVNNVEYNVPSGETILVPSTCPDANYLVQYQNGTEIISGTIASGGSATINVPDVVKDLFLKLAYKENDTFVEWEIQAEEVGIYNTIDTTGLTGVALLVNASPATLPLNLILGNILRIEFDSATTDGSIKLGGSYV